MNWDAIGAVAELFGAAGVVASLLYLGRHGGGERWSSRGLAGVIVHFAFLGLRGTSLTR